MRSFYSLVSVLGLAVLVAIPLLAADEPKETTFPLCPLKHGKWEPIVALSDEFNAGTFDEGKWRNFSPAFPGLPHDPFDPTNVRVADGMMQLDAKLLDAPNTNPAVHEYSTALVQSKVNVRYGYFEVRAKAMDTQVCSAFWFYDATPEEWTEIDVFEINGREKPQTDHMNMHIFNTLVERERWDETMRWHPAYNFSQDFHVFGLEWNADELVWYVDGVERRREKNTHWHQPIAMQFDMEIKPNWFGMPDKDSLPAIFNIDYVRSWRRLDAPVDDRPLSTQFNFPGRVESDKESIYKLKTDGAGTLVVHASGGKERPGSVYTEYVDPAFFAAESGREMAKTITMEDVAGKKLAWEIHWKKVSGLASLLGKKPVDDSMNGYVPCGIDFPADPKKEAGAIDDFEFKAEDGSAIKVTVKWP